MANIANDEATREKVQTEPPTVASTLSQVVENNDSSEEKDLGNDTSDEYPHGWKLIILASASIIAVFLIALDQTIIGTAIPRITDEFHSLDDISWYAAAYFMTFGGFQPSAGKVYKYNNLKWTFIASMFVFELGSLVCGVAPSSTALIVGRAIAGLGGAGLSVGGTSIVSFTVPPAKRPLMIGIIAMTYCIAAVLGPLLGGAFTESASWRWCFYINLPIGGISALSVFAFFQVPTAALPTKVSWTKKLLHIDPIGVVLTMGGIICFVLALQYGGNTHPWNSGLVIGLLVGFALLVAALISWELWLGEYAMMLPRLYKQRSLSTTAPFSFFFMGSYIVLLYYLPLYFQSIRGASPIESGVHNLPLVITAGIFAFAGGAAVAITGRAQQAMVIGSMLATVAIGLIYTFDLHTSMGKWIGYQAFVGAAMAVAILQGLTIAQANVGPEDLTSVTANLSFFQTIGGAFSVSIGQSVFVNRLVTVLPKEAPGVSLTELLAAGASDLRRIFPPEVLHNVLEAYMSGIKAAFAVSLAFSGMAFLVTFIIPMRKLPSHT